MSGWTQPKTVDQSRAEANAYGYDERPITWWEDNGTRRRPGCTCGWKAEAAITNRQLAGDIATAHAQREHGWPTQYTTRWP